LKFETASPPSGAFFYAQTQMEKPPGLAAERLPPVRSVEQPRPAPGDMKLQITTTLAPVRTRL
jgi:hypothetical protein